jgi:hypothetical protein
MVRNRSVRVAVCLLATMWLSASSHASSLADYYDADLANQSAFLRWMAGTELSGLAIPVGIANKPCYFYEGSRLVVYPCPGTVINESAVAPISPECGYRYRVAYRPGVACLSRRY